MRNLSIELRPKSFDEFIGNKNVIAALRKQLSTRVPTTIMFSGEPGTGKTTLGELVAKEINPGADPEIWNINCASENGINAIRELIPKCEYSPWQGSYRVVLLDEAQQLTNSAQNVFLTPLENTSLPTVFIFCTTDPQSMLPALRERCMSFILKGIEGADRVDLVARTFVAAGGEGEADDILSAIQEANITAPRTIVMAVEKFVSGLPPEEAVQCAELDPQLAVIAKAVLSTTNWNTVSPLLKTLKPADAKGLRQVISAFVRQHMFGYLHSPKKAELLRKLALYSSYEAGTDFGALVGVLYDFIGP